MRNTIQHNRNKANNKGSKTAIVLALSLALILGVFQVKLALYQIKSDFGNMTEVQKGIARNVLGQEEYDKLANNNTLKVEQVALLTRESVQPLSRGDIDRLSKVSSDSSISKSSTSQTITTNSLQKVFQTASTTSSVKLSEKERVMLAIEKTCEMLGLDVRLGKVLVHTESGFDPNCIGRNSGSTDYGLCQVNNQGGVIADFLGKKVDLADGRTQVLVTSSNYKTDMYVNLAIGLADYKRYLTDLSGNNPYIAYACYNAGEGTAEIFKGYNKSNLSMSEVVSIMQNHGHKAFKQASRNVRDNFAVKYNMYY